MSFFMMGFWSFPVAFTIGVCLYYRVDVGKWPWN